MKISGCCVLLFLSQGLGLLTAAPPAQGEGPQPELDLLRERVVQFWTLLKERRKADALEYVEPAGRNTFVYRREAKIVSVTLGDIQVGTDPTEAQVTVNMEIRALTATHPLSVSVTERWRFLQGTWVVQIQASNARELFRRKRSRDQKVPVPE